MFPFFIAPSSHSWLSLNPVSLIVIHVLILLVLTNRTACVIDSNLSRALISSFPAKSRAVLPSLSKQGFDLVVSGVIEGRPAIVVRHLEMFYRLVRGDELTDDVHPSFVGSNHQRGVTATL